MARCRWSRPQGAERDDWVGYPELLRSDGRALGLSIVGAWRDMREDQMVGSEMEGASDLFTTPRQGDTFDLDKQRDIKSVFLQACNPQNRGHRHTLAMRVLSMPSQEAGPRHGHIGRSAWIGQRVTMEDAGVRPEIVSNDRN